MTYSIIVGVVYALAVARLTRLINADTILDRPRGWLAGQQRHHRQIATELQPHPEKVETYDYHRRAMQRWETVVYFVACPWCVGMWLALSTAWIPLWFNTNAVARYVGIALAVSHLIGVFAFAADTEEMDYEDETVA